MNEQQSQIQQRKFKFKSEQIKQSENKFFSSSGKKTKLTKKEKITGNRDKFAVFVSSNESDSDCSRNFSNSTASESDNAKAIIAKMKLNKRKKFTKKRDKTNLTFSPNEYDSPSGNTVMFDDNSLSESENSPNIPKNYSKIEKKIIQQDSIQTEGDISSSINEKQSQFTQSKLKFRFEQIQQRENKRFASKSKSNVTFNDLKKTKLKKQEKITGNRDKFSIFVSSNESDSDCSRMFNNSSANEYDNTKA